MTAVLGWGRRRLRLNLADQLGALALNVGLLGLVVAVVALAGTCDLTFT